MKNKLVAILFIIVFVLLVAVICSLLMDGQDVTDIDDVRLSTGAATDSPVVTSIATPTPDPNATPAPAATLLPLPTEAPTPTPEPTPTPGPTPTPVPAGMELASGSFSSANQVALNVVADWSAKTVDANTVAVTVTVSAESYSLHLDPTKSVNVSLAGQYVTLDVPAVTYDGSALAKNELASTTINIDLPAGSSNSYTLAVEWHFGGVYMNMPIEVLECGGTIDLVR